jgi:hypothetical protein
MPIKWFSTYTEARYEADSVREDLYTPIILEFNDDTYGVVDEVTLLRWEYSFTIPVEIVRYKRPEDDEWVVVTYVPAACESSASTRRPSYIA